jgi:hypothetical protein
MAKKKSIKPKLLIITGPQGSGNHLFAKIFCADKRTYGWKMTLKEWQGHHLEPFAEYWRTPTLLKKQKFKNEFYVTSISCPYFYNKKPHDPDYRKFISVAKTIFDITIVILGRDKNILEVQQRRVRSAHTTPRFLKKIKTLMDFELPTFFASQELFFLYGSYYLKLLSTMTQFPIPYKNKSFVKDFLECESNKKYVTAVREGTFDKEIFKACKES